MYELLFQGAALITAGGVVFAFKDKIKVYLTGDIRLGVKRLELLNMMQHRPDQVNTIMNLYDEYSQLNGNSYIQSEYSQWCKKHIKNTPAQD